MSSGRHGFFRDSLGRRAMAGALFALLVLVQSLSSSAWLHVLFHDDAASPEHYCAVKAFAQGQVDVADTSVRLPAPALRTLRATIRPETVFSSVSFLIAPSRAPPAFLG